MTKLNYTLVFIAIIAIASATYSWYKPQPVITKTQYVQVPQIKETVRIKRVEVPVEKVITIEKEVIVNKLKLPDWIKTDKDIQVIATASIEPYEGTTDTVATLNTKTGESKIIAKHRPLRLFALENKREIGARYGVSSGSLTPQVDVYGSWGFARIGNVHISAHGEVNSEATAKASLQGGYRW